jgi:NAD(P)-dependent dehydrogenase (short-subunit alcohol dehydrogenase family)
LSDDWGRQGLSRRGGLAQNRRQFFSPIDPETHGMNDFRFWLAAAILGFCLPSAARAQTPEAPSAAAASVILITGSNRGIGLALASAYAKSGWRVIATCRDPARATELAALAKAYPNLTVEPLDVTSATSIEALAARHEGKPIDVLVNNAGTSGDHKGQLPGSFDEAAFQEIMRVNAFAPLQLSTALLDNVRASRQKKIIAITSGRGSVSKPFPEQRAYFYDMSKAALNLGMRKLQSGVRDQGVLIGIFAPGIVDTDLNENLRNGVPAKRPLISTQESAAGVVTLIANLNAANQDAFMNYNGDKFSW